MLLFVYTMKIMEVRRVNDSKLITGYHLWNPVDSNYTLYIYTQTDSFGQSQDKNSKNWNRRLLAPPWPTVDLQSAVLYLLTFENSLLWQVAALLNLITQPLFPQKFSRNDFRMRGSSSPWDIALTDSNCSKFLQARGYVPLSKLPKLGMFKKLTRCSIKILYLSYGYCLRYLSAS